MWKSTHWLDVGNSDLCKTPVRVLPWFALSGTKARARALTGQSRAIEPHAGTALQEKELVDRLVGMARVTTVGAFDAKTHLNALLEKVSKGETIRITRRGAPIAKLVPDDTAEKEMPDVLVREIRQLRKGATLGKTTIRELINEGRRH